MQVDGSSWIGLGTPWLGLAGSAIHIFSFFLLFSSEISQWWWMPIILSPNLPRQLLQSTNKLDQKSGSRLLERNRDDKKAEEMALLQQLLMMMTKNSMTRPRPISASIVYGRVLHCYRYGLGLTKAVFSFWERWSVNCILAREPRPTRQEDNNTWQKRPVSRVRDDDAGGRTSREPVERCQEWTKSCWHLVTFCYCDDDKLFLKKKKKKTA